MAGVKFDITGNANGFVQATRQAEAASGSMIKRITSDGKALDDMFKKLATSVGSLFVAQQVKKIMDVRGEFQQLGIAMETMLGSTEKANALMGQLTSTAAKTPFGLTDIAQGAKQLLAYGTASENVNDTLVRLGNIASGLSIPLNDLVYLYGTTMTQGRLFTQDLRQFMGRGIPLADELAKQFGVTKDKVGELVTAGRVGFPEVEKAIMSMTNEGGKFYNLMEKQSSSLTGQISNLEDQFDIMLNEIGTSMQDALGKGISLASSLIENYERVGRIIASIAATYGTYKAAVIAVTVVEKMQAAARLASILGTSMLSTVTGILAKKTGILNAVMKANPYVLIATAVVGLGSAMWALADHTTAAERAQKNYSKAQEEAANQEAERKQKVEESLEVVRDANQTEAERISALLELKREYPGIFDQYDIEKLKLADILDIKKQIAEEDRKRKTASTEEQYAANQKWLNANRQTYNNGGKAFKKNYETKQEEQKLLRQDYTETKVEDYISGMGDRSTEYLQKVLAIAQRANAGNGRFLLEGTKVMAQGSVDLTQLKTLSIEGENLVSVIEAINTELAKRNEVVPTYADAYKNAEKEWEEAKTKLKAIRKDKAKFTEKEYTDQVALEKEKRKAFEALGGYTKGKDNRKESAKADAVRVKAEREAARAREDIAAEAEKALIETYTNGAEKRRALIDWEHRQEITKLQRQKEDFVDAAIERERAVFEAEEEAKAAKNKDYEKATFDEDAARQRALDSTEVAQYDKIIAYTKTRQNQATLDAEREAWQNYYIEYGDFKNKILNLEQQYNDRIEKAKTEGEKKSLQAERDKVLDELKKGQDIAYKNIFKDPTKMSLASVKDAIAVANKEIKKITSKGILNDNDIENLKALQESVDKLQSYTESAPFDNLGDGLDGLVAKFNTILSLNKRIAKAKQIGNKEAQQTAEEELKATKSNLKENLIGVGVEGFASSLTIAADALERIAEISGDANLQLTADVLSGTANVITSVGMGAAAGGWIGAVIGGVTSILSEAANAITDFIVANETNKRAMEDYAQSIELLALTVNDDKYNTIFGTDNWAKMLETGRKQSDAYTKLMEDTARRTQTIMQNETLAGGGTISYPIEITRGGVGDSGIQAKGKNKKKYSGTLSDIFPDLFNEDGTLKLDKIEEAKAALETLNSMKLKEAGGRDRLKEAIDDAEAYLGLTKEIEDAVGSYLNNWADNLGDAIVDSVMRGEDAMDSFEDVALGVIDTLARDLAKSFVLSNYFNTFSEDMQSAFTSGDPNQIINVIDDIMLGLPNAIEGTTAAVKGIYDYAESAGLDVSKLYESTRTASAKGVAQASQSSIDDLTGRATNIQSHTFSIHNDMKSVISINTQILAAVRNIENNTNRLEQIETDIELMQDNLSTIVTRGITVRRA